MKTEESSSSGYGPMGQENPKIFGFYIDTAMRITIWLHGFFALAMVIVAIYSSIEGSYANLWNLGAAAMNVFLIFCVFSTLKTELPRRLLPFFVLKPIELVIRISLLIYHGQLAVQHMSVWEGRIEYWTAHSNETFVAAFKEAQDDARDRLFAVSALVAIYVLVEIQQMAALFLAYRYYQQKLIRKITTPTDVETKPESKPTSASN